MTPTTIASKSHFSTSRSSSELAKLITIESLCAPETYPSATKMSPGSATSVPSSSLSSNSIGDLSEDERAENSAISPMMLKIKPTSEKTQPSQALSFCYGPVRGSSSPHSSTYDESSKSSHRFRCQHLGCEKSFRHNGDLTRHVRVHTKEKPFVCDFPDCGKAFSQACNLTTHHRVHTKERPFVCTFPGCGKKFSSASYVPKHELKAHYSS
eukprot:c8264_g1_i1.p1 GENE.c8264_g1_i1~~c8264_g1_i1.p1  ORF type:complete len:211 (-),score=15.12 c8264_g1_i1:312-944(-)